MDKKNDFDREELARWYSDAYACFWCELTKTDKKKWNYGNSFHHILGRNGKYKNSLLNSFFINNEFCHLPNHPLLKKRVNKIRLLKKTMEWLLFKGYVFTKLDEQFIDKHQGLYKEILNND